MGQPEEIILTHADLRQMPEDGRRHELLEGRLEVSPSATSLHQTILMNLIGLLLPWIRERDLGRLYTAPLDVILSDTNVLEPDLLFIAKARLGNLVGKWIHGAPDLVIEILSPSTETRDRGAKMQIYARFGVREYWLVDPESRTVSIHVLEGSGYRVHASGCGDAHIISPALAGYPLVPAEVFRER
jgi:Uma2 family endonuclease